MERRGIARLSDSAGRTMDTVEVTPAAGATGDWELVLEYRGAATLSPRGERYPQVLVVQFYFKARLEVV